MVHDRTCSDSFDHYARFVVALFVTLVATDVGADDVNREQDRQRARTDAKPDWHFLDNGTVRIGIDKSRGGCIGFFGESSTNLNLLNHFDTGRFIQQSYYGGPDGSDWNGKPWVYNPVQGGEWKGQPSKLLEFQKDDNGSSVRVKVEPLSWASGVRCPEAIMMSLISLDGHFAHVEMSMKYTGDDQGPPRSQEMPAIFAIAELNQLVYSDDGELKRRVPSWPNESGRATESWLAYVNDSDWGVGVYVPGTTEFTCYRFTGNGKQGPSGSACSYVAPLRKFALKPGLTVEYDFYLTIGRLNEIQKRFLKLKGREESSPSKQND